MLLKVGYWRPNKISPWSAIEELKLPDVRTMVDETWDLSELEIVLKHLKNGRIKDHYKGWSSCRFCGIENGSCDKTDNTYLWPEGFEHYIEKHNVKPPIEFIEHCIALQKLLRCLIENQKERSIIG